MSSSAAPESPLQRYIRCFGTDPQAQSDLCVTAHCPDLIDRNGQKICTGTNQTCPFESHTIRIDICPPSSRRRSP